MLLAAQVALSMLLVVTAVLLGRSLTNANAIDPGFAIAGVDVADFDLRLGGTGPRHPVPSSTSLIARVQRLPGVESAALARVVPLTREREGGRVWLPGEQGDDRAITSAGTSSRLTTSACSACRCCAAVASTSAIAPVRQPSRSSTRRWRDARGRDRIRSVSCCYRGVSRRPLRVIGVVRDTKYRTIGEDPSPFVYIPRRKPTKP